MNACLIKTKNLIRDSMIAPNNFLESFVILDDVLTKKELSICKSYLWFFKELVVGNHEKTFPSIKTIAKMSKCCPRTVNTFIKKYEGIIIKHTSSKNPKTGKNNPNEYDFNPDFFESLSLLEYGGFLHKWSDKKVRRNVLKRYIDDEWFLHKVIQGKGLLIEKKNARGFLQNLRTINSFLLIPSSNKDLKARPPVSGEQKKGFGVLQGLPLNFIQKQRLTESFGTFHLKNAVEQYNYITCQNYKQSKNINNTNSLIFTLARKSTLKSFERRATYGKTN